MPKGNSQGKKLNYIAAGGTAVEFYGLGRWGIRIITRDKDSQITQADMVASMAETEIVMNDVLRGELGINLLDLKNGLRRFRDDPSDLERPSERRCIY